MFGLPLAQRRCRFLHEHYSSARGACSNTQADPGWIQVCKIAWKSSVLFSSDNETHDLCSHPRWQHDRPQPSPANIETSRAYDQGILGTLKMHTWADFDLLP